MTCATQTAKAYEYVFNFAENYASREVKDNIVSFTMPNENGEPLIQLSITTDKNVPNAVERVKLTSDNKLAVPCLSRLTVKINDGYNMRVIWIGGINSNRNAAYDEVLSGGVTDDQIRDWNNQLSLWSIGTQEHLFVAGMNTSAYNKILGKFFYSNANSLSDLNDKSRDYYFGPEITIWSEGVKMEDLTNADHNVRLMSHVVTDEMVGVAVKTVNYQDYLIVRSANQLSPEYRQTMRPDQESFKDENGNVYEWSNPNTPQYAWMMMKIDNPINYVGKKFTNVRGKYCDFSTEQYHVFWLNPFMQVASADVKNIQITGDESTILNKYPLANFVLPKDDHYFLLKPNLSELCDIQDVMRSHRDHFIYVPDENALMPEVTITDKNGNEQVVAQSNFYVDNDLSYGQDYSYASFLDNEGIKPYEASDREMLNGQTYSFDWELYDKIYDFPSSLVVAAHHGADHGGESSYVYPLSLPNNKYTQSVNDMVLNIVGEGVLKKYKTDFYVGNEDYWSRYKYNENRNAYRNDISFTYSKPITSASNKDITLNIFRCNDKGEQLAKVAEVKNNQWDPKKFTVTSTVDAQEAKDEDVLKDLGTAPSFPNGQEFLIGEKDANGNYVTRIFLSDMFYSTSMENAEKNGKLSSDYQYRIEASIDGVTSVVGYAPVYKTNKNVVTRANYSQAEVDADRYNTLEENDKAEINFTPNMAKAMTAYRVYKGDATQGENFANIASSAIVLNNNFLDQAIEDEDEIVDGTVYVPELYTEYNDNTYGCYKQSVSDAEVSLDVKSMVASEFVNSDGKRYVHATIALGSTIKNTDKDSRYLVRVWRQVGNGDLVLLNGHDEAWETNYADLATLGLEDYAKENAALPFYLNDTFEATAQSSQPSGAPMLMSEGETVNIEDVKYYATLYVLDDASGKYYVKKVESEKLTSIPTAISTVNTGAQVESVRYYNTIGVESETPFQGLNIVVTRYSDGTTTTVKAVR